MDQILVHLLTIPFAHLPGPDDEFSVFRDFYALACLTLLLAVVNGAIACACSSAIAFGKHDGSAVLIGKSAFLISLAIQCLCGCIPMLVCSSSLISGFYVYDSMRWMPLVVVAIVSFCLYYQFKLVRIYLSITTRRAIRHADQ